MGIWEKFKTYMDAPEPDYDDEDEVDEDETEQAEEKIVNPKREPVKKSAPRDDYNLAAFERSASSRSTFKSTTVGHSTKVVDIHTTAKLQVVLTKPEKFSDAREIADNLNEKRTIVLNLESTSKDEALRLLDFLSGVAYANDGEIKKIAKSTFIITPYNVDVMGDLLYELENNGVYFV
ncbi:MAG: cell division protein SepF [Clostridia bacterium]|nr:cell division protein SepF [Clostridia bacterium]